MGRRWGVLFLDNRPSWIEGAAWGNVPTRLKPMAFASQSRMGCARLM